MNKTTRPVRYVSLLLLFCRRCCSMAHTYYLRCNQALIFVALLVVAEFVYTKRSCAADACSNGAFNHTCNCSAVAS